jgi:hypothetical protein
MKMLEPHFPWKHNSDDIRELRNSKLLNRESTTYRPRLKKGFRKAGIRGHSPGYASCRELAGYPIRLPVLEEIVGLQVKIQEELVGNRS